MADVNRIGELRAADPYRTLKNMARTKNMARRSKIPPSGRFSGGALRIHCRIVSIVSTSGRIHAEFLRLLYILAHRRTIAWFQRLGIDAPGPDAFTWRRSEYVYHTRAAIGLAIAVATAKRVQVADHTLYRR